MISINLPYISPKSHTGILINGHLTAHVSADVTGYYIQYLRRLLRSGKLEGIKIGQIWLIEMQSLESFLQHVESTSGRRCGLFGRRVYKCRRETVYESIQQENGGMK